MDQVKSLKMAHQDCTNEVNAMHSTLKKLLQTYDQNDLHMRRFTKNRIRIADIKSWALEMRMEMEIIDSSLNAISDSLKDSAVKEAI